MARLFRGTGPWFLLNFGVITLSGANKECSSYIYHFCMGQFYLWDSSAVVPRKSRSNKSFWRLETIQFLYISPRMGPSWVFPWDRTLVPRKLEANMSFRRLGTSQPVCKTLRSPHLHLPAMPCSTFLERAGPWYTS